jgi:hypothetical protein
LHDTVADGDEGLCCQQRHHHSNGTSNVSGNGYPNGYQAGISDFGNHDNIVNNKISWTGHTASFEPTPGSLYTLIDTSGSTHPHVSK